ncbi:MAG: aldo/keto reductase [Alphaproteobacteria bacterium]|nr:aldo/keto reductase [Pseudomonadota bacterium]
MKKRWLGSSLETSAIGLGCMPMTRIYGEPDENEAIATIHRAIDLGVDYIDTSDAYGNGKNEELVGRALKGRRDKVILVTKFGNIRHPDGRREVNGRPEYVAQACDASLERLGVDVIDHFYVHRIDPNTPIEDTVGALARLVEAGKVRHLGLCEAAPATLRRAHGTHPIAALQTEYSLWTRFAEDELLPTCRELGIGYVAYCPLGRGFLTATIKSLDVLADNDRRRDMPRFQDENIGHNVKLLEVLEEMAGAKGCTPAQLALAWVLAQHDFIVPIPGTMRRGHLEENAKAADITLDDADVARLGEAIPPGAALGERYPPGQLKALNL